MVCKRCNFRIVGGGTVRYCKNYVSCRRSCSNRCWLHTEGGRRLCVQDRLRGQVVIIILAYNGVTCPVVWERWLDGLAPQYQDRIKFLVHTDDNLDRDHRSFPFVKRYESEWTNTINLQDERGSFRFVARSLTLLAEALVRFPLAEHYCFVDGETIPICQPEDLLNLAVNRSYISYEFICLEDPNDPANQDQGEEPPEAPIDQENRVTRVIDFINFHGIEYDAPPQVEWRDPIFDGFGLINHNRGMLLSRKHSKKILKTLLDIKHFNRNLLEHVATSEATYDSLNAFGKDDQAIADDFKTLLYAYPDEYIIGNTLVMALGRDTFKTEVINTDIVAYIKKQIVNANGDIDISARKFIGVNEVHAAVGQSLSDILQAIRWGHTGNIPNFEPQNIANVLFFRKVGEEVSQRRLLYNIPNHGMIMDELWPEFNIQNIEDNDSLSSSESEMDANYDD